MQAGATSAEYSNSQWRVVLHKKPGAGLAASTAFGMARAFSISRLRLATKKGRFLDAHICRYHRTFSRYCLQHRAGTRAGLADAPVDHGGALGSRRRHRHYGPDHGAPHVRDSRPNSNRRKSSRRRRNGRCFARRQSGSGWLHLHLGKQVGSHRYDTLQTSDLQFEGRSRSRRSRRRPANNFGRAQGFSSRRPEGFRDLREAKREHHENGRRRCRFDGRDRLRFVQRDDRREHSTDSVSAAVRRCRT